jgi:hypothetical protein
MTIPAVKLTAARSSGSFGRKAFLLPLEGSRLRKDKFSGKVPLVRLGFVSKSRALF